jgi:assimilatory nitrate reductase catalytic subunit
MAEAVRTTCPYCGVGCGILAKVENGALSVAGDPDHPANRGRLCLKGASLGETVGLDGRLLEPKIDGAPASWDAALDRLAGAFAAAIAAHGPDSVALYVSGQLLTEDYYVANKLMKGFIGSANIDTNSRLCMSSSVAGHMRAFGSDTVPGCYEDLETADLIVLVGANAAWCHPVLFQRIDAARKTSGRPRLVVIDPRRTASADSADLHLALRPGSDAALFNALLAHLATRDAIDRDFVAHHTAGLEAALEAAGRDGVVAEACDLDPADIATFFDWFTQTERVVTLYSQGVNQSTSGTDKVNAIINCHLLTGRIGRPGMGPLSLTGQPNAMGGREVGGLANQLAAHMAFEDDAIDRVARFWRAPRLARRPGLKAVDLFHAVDEGRIKALWIMATNPAVSLPDSALVRRALERCDFVAVSDCVEHTDTTRLADVLLPALAWAEKDGTVTNSERCISRQRTILPPPGAAMPDWWIVCEIAKRLGFGADFAFDSPAAIFREHAALSAFENEGSRDFDIGGLTGADYASLAPVQWPVREPGGATARLFGDGRFFHGDGKARFVAVTPRPPASRPSEDWPLLLNTGRTRDHWHTLTRSGLSPRLCNHEPEPWLSIHPDDAARFGLAQEGLVRVESPRGVALLRVRIDPGQRRGEVFAPMHWNDQFAADARVGALIAPLTDPVSGQPELKCTPVRVRPAPIAWEASLLTRAPLGFWEEGLFWARAAGDGHTLYRLAGNAEIDNWRGWMQHRLSTDHWIEYEDRGLGAYRGLFLREGRLEAALFVGPPGARPAPDWLAELFATPSFAMRDPAALLLGEAATESAPAGRIVCSCFLVREPAIGAAIREGGLSSVDEIGRRLSAGTNCGSCVPELRRLLRETHAAERDKREFVTLSTAQ